MIKEKLDIIKQVICKFTQSRVDHEQVRSALEFCRQILMALSHHSTITQRYTGHRLTYQDRPQGDYSNLHDQSSLGTTDVNHEFDIYDDLLVFKFVEITLIYTPGRPPRALKHKLVSSTITGPFVCCAAILT